MRSSSETSIPYIMTPELFARLSFVRGFNNMNGETYQSHILLVLNSYLSNEDKLVIIGTRTPEDALAALDKLGIKYTHEMN